MNPYLELVERLPLTDDGEVPQGQLALARSVAVKRYAWAIPNERALQRLLELGPIVEIGAGTGYWAHLLQVRGGDVIAYDQQPGQNPWISGPLFTDVKQGTHREAGRHPDRALFLCWPPYNESMATRAVIAHRRAGGQHVAFVGEHNGCTGNDSLFMAFHRWYELVDEVEIPRWQYINDRLYIYKVKHGRRKETRHVRRTQGSTVGREEQSQAQETD